VVIGYSYSDSLAGLGPLFDEVRERIGCLNFCCDNAKIKAKTNIDIAKEFTRSRYLFLSFHSLNPLKISRGFRTRLNTTSPTFHALTGSS
jgi:hypothetical protein